MRVVVDIERCRGAGQCVRTAPQVFDQDDEDGTVVVLDEEPPPQLHGAVRMAAGLCPNSVIRVVNDAPDDDSPRRADLRVFRHECGSAEG